MKKIALALCAFLSISYMYGDEIAWTSPPDTLSSAGVDASDPQIAIDIGGNAVALWVEEGFIKAGNKPLEDSWSAAATLSNAGSSSPRLGVDANGTATAIWLDGSTVMAATKTLEGSWSEPSALSSSGASEPHLFVDASGNAVAVWTRDSHIESATKPDGGSWSAAPETLSSLAIPSDSPHVAIGGDGTTIAVWHGTVASIDTIYAASKTILGTWGLSQAISTSGVNSVKPYVAVDSSGDAIAVWFRYGFSGGFVAHVAAQAASKPADNGWEAPVDLSAEGVRDPADLQIRVAFDNSGNAMAAWTTSFDGTNYFFETSVRPVLQGWQEPYDLALDYNVYGFDLASSDVGEAFAAWMQFDVANSALAVNAAEADMNGFLGNFFSGIQTISTVGSPSGFPKLSAKLSGAGTGNYLAAAWLNFDGSNDVIQAAIGQEDVISPPQNPSVDQEATDLGVATEYYNTISWEASAFPDVAGYLVLRNGLLIGQTDAATFSFVDRSQKENGSVTYAVAAFDAAGSQSDAVTVSFP